MVAGLALLAVVWLGTASDGAEAERVLDTARAFERGERTICRDLHGAVPGLRGRKVKPTATSEPASSARPHPSPPAAPEPSEWLYGSVRDDRGRPVTDVGVEVLFRGPKARPLPRLRGTHTVSPEQDGTFRLPIPQRANMAKLRIYTAPPWIAPPSVYVRPGGRHTWMLPGYSHGIATDDQGLLWKKDRPMGPNWPSVHLRVEAGAVLRGRVLAAGTRPLRPVDRISVRARWRHGLLGTRSVETKTGSDGGFTLTVPASALDLEVAVPCVSRRLGIYRCGRASRYREFTHPGISRCDVRPGDDDIQLTLPATHEIGGRVELEDGTPVRLQDERCPPSPPRSPIRAADGARYATLSVNRLDEDGIQVAALVCGGQDGTFRVREATRGRYLLEVYGKGDDYEGPILGRAIVTVPGPSVSLVCRSTRTLAGQVLVDDPGGFLVCWIPRGRPQHSVVPRQLSLPDGSFSIPYLGEEPGTLYVSRPDDPRHAWIEDVRPGKARLRVRLQKGQCITGRVLGIRIEDEESVTVEASHDSLDLWATIGLDGEFVFQGLPPGRFDLVLILKRGRGHLRVAEHRDVPTGTDVTFDLRR